MELSVIILLENVFVQLAGQEYCVMKVSFAQALSILCINTFHSSTECSEGYYGSNCQLPCQCQNDADCNQTTGECYCTPGWMGVLCDEGNMLRSWFYIIKVLYFSL